METTGREVINQVYVLEEKLVTVEKSFKELRVQSHLKKNYFHDTMSLDYVCPKITVIRAYDNF